MAGTATTVSENCCGCEVAPLLSFTVTLKLKGLPVALVGVPVITPVDALRERPGGRDPVVTVHELYGETPPVAAKAAE
jgi:hypothetical protein